MKKGPKENRFDRAIDTLFSDSASRSTVPGATGVILTGNLMLETDRLVGEQQRGGSRSCRSPKTRKCERKCRAVRRRRAPGLYIVPLSR